MPALGLLPDSKPRRGPSWATQRARGRRCIQDSAQTDWLGRGFEPRPGRVISAPPPAAHPGAASPRPGLNKQLSRPPNRPDSNHHSAMRLVRWMIFMRANVMSRRAAWPIEEEVKAGADVPRRGSARFRSATTGSCPPPRGRARGQPWWCGPCGIAPLTMVAGGHNEVPFIDSNWALMRRRVSRMPVRSTVRRSATICLARSGRESAWQRNAVRPSRSCRNVWVIRQRAGA
jgi:hypothetical protein